MPKKVNLHTNMNDQELQDYLTYALNGLQVYKEPSRKFQDKLSNELRDENVEFIKQVIDDMVDEIKTVIK